MGPNDKKRARKAKKQKVRKERIRQYRANQSGESQSPHLAHHHVSHINNTLEFSQNFRKTCSECNSPNIAWSTVGELALNGNEQVRERAKELLPVFGASAIAWSCSECEGFGAFEQSMEIG